VSRALRVAVIGLGVGEQHVGALAAQQDLFDLVALCDLDPAKAKAAAAKHGVSVPIETDVARLLREGRLDVVHICTPPSTHFALTKHALEAGVHVVCEKPLVGSLADVDRLAEISRFTGHHVVPIFQYRFGDGLQRLKRLRDAGLTGDALLTTIETAWLRGADYYAVPWRGKWATELGGVCITQAIHAHDMLTYILGPIASVAARVATRVNPIEVEDCAAASVEMADGSLATLSATLGSARQISRLRFVFRNLTAESNLDAYRPSRDPWTFLAVDPDRQAEIDRVANAHVAGLQFFQAQFAATHAALGQRTPLPVTLADARASLELIVAIYHSARTGERVRLPIGPDHPLYGGWLP
jgi:predicted dehydrogenase